MYFGTGAVLALLVAVLPGNEGLSQPWFLTIGALAGVAALAMLLGAERVSVGIMHVIVPGGTVLLSLAVYHAGSLSGAASVFFMTATYPFTFFRRNVALAYAAGAGAAYALVLALADGSDGDLSRWLLLMGTLLAVGLAFNWIVLRLEAVQSELADLNRTLERRVEDGLRELNLRAEELEAMQNAAKHAGDGAEIAVMLTVSDGELWFEVADTGAGFELGAGNDGQGFVNMADRLGAFGGRVTVSSSPGAGTRVCGVIPIL